MSQEGARQRAGLWLRQANDDLRAARILQGAAQAAQACFLAQQTGEKALKALLAAEDRDLRSHSLGALLRELGEEPAQRWQRQARVLKWTLLPPALIKRLAAGGWSVDVELFRPGRSSG